MRPHLLIFPILALCTTPAPAQDTPSSVDVLAAIAADAGAPAQPEAPPALTLTERLTEVPQASQAAPQPPIAPLSPEADEATGESAVDRASTPATPIAPAALADTTRGTCNIGRGERWQQQPDLTLEQCAAALTGGNQPYDEHGLRHAYWPGVYLSASSTAIYQSSNGSDWTRLHHPDAD